MLVRGNVMAKKKRKRNRCVCMCRTVMEWWQSPVNWKTEVRTILVQSKRVVISQCCSKSTTSFPRPLSFSAPRVHPLLVLNGNSTITVSVFKCRQRCLHRQYAVFWQAGANHLRIGTLRQEKLAVVLSVNRSVIALFFVLCVHLKKIENKRKQKISTMLNECQTLQ